MVQFPWLNHSYLKHINTSENMETLFKQTILTAKCFLAECTAESVEHMGWRIGDKIRSIYNDNHQNVIDMMIVLDSSGSIGSDNFDKAKAVAKVRKVFDTLDCNTS